MLFILFLTIYLFLSLLSDSFAIASIQLPQSLYNYQTTFSPMFGSPASPPQGDLTDMFGIKSPFWPPPWSLLILAAIGLIVWWYCKKHCINFYVSIEYCDENRGIIIIQMAY